MSRSALKTIQAAAGAAGGGPVYVDDVFSTYLYDGNGSTQTITNSIDLAGEGGLVWTRWRSGYYTSRDHNLWDTERGTTGYLNTNNTAAEKTPYTNAITYNSNGFTLNNQFPSNMSFGSETFASWTFRKQPGFFDVVTYTGDGTQNRPVPHNLGSAPGMILIKSLDVARGWFVWHRGISATWTGNKTPGSTAGGNDVGKLSLNSTDAFSSGYGGFTYADDTAFGVYRSNTDENVSGEKYVAYVFAHNDQSFGEDEDEAIIKCGSYTGNGSSTGPTIDLGFEPQWVMIKCTTQGSSGWIMHDTMRGWTADGKPIARLRADLSSAEYNDANYTEVAVTSTGFRMTGSNYQLNGSGDEYIYMAIRRPNKPASEFNPEKLLAVPSYYTAGDPVFQLINASTPIDFTIDMAITRHGGAIDDTEISSRLTQDKLLYTNTTAAQTTDSNMKFDYSNGYHAGVSGATANMEGIGFRRAPGFFDVVAYTGTGSAQNVSHNLGVAPEMMIIKNRSDSIEWAVYHSGLSSVSFPDAEDNRLTLNSANASQGTGHFSSTAPTESVFSIGGGSEVGVSGHNYIAYLFATLPGISKVGSYTGTGSEQTIDCGFTAGSNFVMIKRTDSTGNWWYARGSYVGVNYVNSRLYAFNNEERDYVTQGLKNDATGFTVQASNSNTNVNGATYIFYAIA